MSILEGRNLVKEYKQGNNTLYALDKVNVSINESEFVAIVGESGSGKSTLLNVLSGMDIPTSGEVFYNNEPLPHENKELAELRAKEIGVIFQSFHLLPMLTAEENILLPLKFLKKSSVDNKDEELGKLLDELSLTGREKHLPSELSGGQQQRVAIARALINRPKLLFADEPTGNLDKKTSFEIINLMISLREKYNMTLVVVTHSDKIAELAERKISMEDGRIVYDERQR